MKVTVDFGVPHHYQTLHDAAAWAVKWFNIAHLDDRIAIHFIGHEGVPTTSNSHVFGTCTGNRHGVEIQVYAKRPLFRVLSTLFHEITHANQMIRGALTHHNEQSFWYGSPVFEEYWDRPQEVEARRFQRKLLAEYAAKQTKEKLWKTMSGLGLAFKQLSRLLMP